MSKPSTISGSMQIGNKKVTVKLALLLFEDGGVNIAYCPAVNVYGYGNTSTEASKSFEVCLEEFFTYTLHKKTLVKELENLGWRIKKEHKFYPPEFSSLLDKNKTLHKILNTRNFTKIDQDFTIPAFS